MANTSYDLIETTINKDTPYGRVKRRRYQCSKCGIMTYTKNFNYCGNCGVRLNKTNKRSHEWKQAEWDRINGLV